MLITKVTNKIKTPLRRIYHPEIRRTDIVVDIGCGPNPAPRANVACDSSEDDTERAAALRIDRPFVWADIHSLPFRDKAFDYSILSHVLEHLEDPARSLKEVERVSRAGYIETPNALAEIAVAYTFHLSRVTVVDGKLVITFKQRWDEALPPSYADVTADIKKAVAFIMEVDWNRTITQYKWNDHIEFEVRGSIGGFSKPTVDSKGLPVGIIKRWVISSIYQLMRPPVVNLDSYLASPCCKTSLAKLTEELECTLCKRRFGKTRGHWDFRIAK